MSPDTPTKLRLPLEAAAPQALGPGGLTPALQAFAALGAASATEPLLHRGRATLPATEGEARARAIRVLEVLEHARVPAPDRLVLVRLPRERDAAAATELAWHVAPVYAVRLGVVASLDAVVDPFLRDAPLGFPEWAAQLGVEAIAWLAPADVIAATAVELLPPRLAR